jgi:hypothetical protein
VERDLGLDLREGILELAVLVAKGERGPDPLEARSVLPFSQEHISLQSGGKRQTAWIQAGGRCPYLWFWGPWQLRARRFETSLCLRLLLITIAQCGRDGEVRFYGTISNDLHAIETALTKIRQAHAGPEACYEAGPCGFGIARRRMQLNIPCTVVAPSLIPTRSGDRVKKPTSVIA